MVRQPGRGAPARLSEMGSVAIRERARGEHAVAGRARAAVGEATRPPGSGSVAAGRDGVRPAQLSKMGRANRTVKRFPPFSVKRFPPFSSHLRIRRPQTVCMPHLSKISVPDLEKLYIVLLSHISFTHPPPHYQNHTQSSSVRFS
jgi:hypothetical protein